MIATIFLSLLLTSLNSSQEVEEALTEAREEEPEPEPANTELKADSSEAQPEEKPLKRIRVLVVDDHEVVRKGIGALFCEQEDFELAGQAASSRNALVMTQQLQPDIVLLDVFLGETNGLDIAQQLMRVSPGTRIVAFTGSRDDEQLLRAMRLGLHGYVQKAQPLDDLVAVLRTVAKGERVITEPRSITRILDEFSRLTKEQERMRSGLTDLEIELIGLAAEGCSNKEIAARQFWSEVTVKRKMQDIYRKLHVTDRAQAVAEVMRMGLI